MTFTFAYDSYIFTAYINKEENGEYNISLENDFDCPEAYELAKEVAIGLGLLG
jgi:hypothetical protein